MFFSLNEIFPENLSSIDAAVLEELGNIETRRQTHWHPIALKEGKDYNYLTFSCNIIALLCHNV